MKQKRLRLPQRVYRVKRPAKPGPGLTSTGTEVRPVLVAGLTKEGDEFERFLHFLFKAVDAKPRS